MVQGEPMARKNWVFAVVLTLVLLMGLPQLHRAEAGTTVNLVLNNIPAG